MISFLTSKSTSYDPVNAYNKPPKTESTLSVSVDMKLLSPIYSTDDGSSTLLRLSHSAKAVVSYPFHAFMYLHGFKILTAKESSVSNCFYVGRDFDMYKVVAV